MNANISGNRRWLAAVSLAVTFSVVGFLGLRADRVWAAGATPAVETAAPGGPRHGYSTVVKRVLPAVVNISSSKTVKQNTEFGGDEDQLFRQFFGRSFGNVPRERREKGLGSGVIVSSDGYVLTNNHVVDGATDIEVTLHDKREFKAKVVGTDPRTDIAVLKIDGSGFPTLALADSSKVDVGDIVLAVGNPFGVGQTVTMGIVSATGRSGLGIEQVEDFIQTDAPINPGNSGGALVDEDGHLIGINTAIVGGSGQNAGIGFAVPVNMARHDMDQIVAHGKVEHAYLGVVPQDVNPSLAKAFNTQTMGALVSEVSPDSPASHAGLKSGDIIQTVNGQPVENANQLRLRIGEMSAGAAVNLGVLRDGKEISLSVPLGEFPSTQERASNGRPGSRRGDSSGLPGVEVETLTPEMAREMQVSSQTKGVVVNNVNGDSKAAIAGLERGDVILQVNRRPVTNTSEFQQALSAASNGQPVLLLINRQGTNLFLAV
jgi:serine protease Do